MKKILNQIILIKIIIILRKENQLLLIKQILKKIKKKFIHYNRIWKNYIKLEHAMMKKLKNILNSSEIWFI